MIECSFIYPDDLQHSIEKKHIHWSLIESYVKSYPEITFILTHFSPRYKETEIKDFFNKLNLPNIILWTQKN